MISVDENKGALSSSEGFSMLELLIAISIFSIGILAVAEMQIRSIQSNAFANNMTVATTLAQDKIDELKNQAIGSTALAVGSYGDGNNPLAANGAGGGNFTRTWGVANRTANTRLLTVTVSWPGGHSVTLTTITRGGGA